MKSRTIVGIALLIFFIAMLNIIAIGFLQKSSSDNLNPVALIDKTTLNKTSLSKNVQTSTNNSVDNNTNVATNQPAPQDTPSPAPTRKITSAS
jgi:hypothetical protein